MLGQIPQNRLGGYLESACYQVHRPVSSVNDASTERGSPYIC